MTKSTVVLAIILLLFGSSAWAAASGLRAERLRGQVWLVRGGKSRLLGGEVALRKGDRITTGSNSSVEIRQAPEVRWIQLRSASSVQVEAKGLTLQYGIGLSQGLELRILTAGLAPSKDCLALVSLSRSEGELQGRIAGQIPPLPVKFPAPEAQFGRVSIVNGTGTLRLAKSRLDVRAGDQAGIYAGSSELGARTVSVSELKALIETLGFEAGP